MAGEKSQSKRILTTKNKTQKTNSKSEVYNNVSMNSFGFDDGVPFFVTSSVDVSINNKKIAVTYMEENSEGSSYRVTYEGKEITPGHFELKSLNNFNDRATLHRFKDSKILEGSWFEEGSEGMWKINLNRNYNG